MFRMMPSGLAPVSNRNRCSVPPLATVTRTEKPCSASSGLGVWPPVIVVHGRRGPLPMVMRWAGPISGSSMSAMLSISVVTTTESTGSRSISMAGSTSCRTGAGSVAGLSSVHTGRPARGRRVRWTRARGRGSGGGAGRVVAAISRALSTYTR